MVDKGAQLPELFAEYGKAGLLYSVRTSRKAKRVILQVTEFGLLQVILPRGARRSLIPDVLREHREWIDSATSRARARVLSQPLLDRSVPPTEIQLSALQEVWSVSLRNRPYSKPALEQPRPFALQLVGDLRNPVTWSGLLRSWLARCEGSSSCCHGFLEKASVPAYVFGVRVCGFSEHAGGAVRLTGISASMRGS